MRVLIFILTLAVTFSCNKPTYCDPGACPQEEDIPLFSSLNSTWYEFSDDISQTMFFQDTLSGNIMELRITENDVLHAKTSCEECKGYRVYQHFQGKWISYDGESLGIDFSIQSNSEKSSDNVRFSGGISSNDPHLYYGNFVNLEFSAAESPVYDSIILGGTKFYNVYWKTGTGEIYFTKEEGVIAFDASDISGFYVLLP